MKSISSGTVREDDCDYTVLSEESSIEAILLQGKLFWRIEIRALPTSAGDTDETQVIDGDEEDSDASYDDRLSMDLTFSDPDCHNFRALEGRQRTVDMRGTLCPEILPGHPAIVAKSYMSLFAHYNKLTFGRVRDFVIDLNWHCTATDPEIDFDGPLEYEFDFSGQLKWKGLEVDYTHVVDQERLSRGGDFGSVVEFESFCNGWQPDYDDARLQLQRFFDLNDFGPPQRGLFTVIFPVRTES